MQRLLVMGFTLNVQDKGRDCFWGVCRIILMVTVMWLQYLLHMYSHKIAEAWINIVFKHWSSSCCTPHLYSCASSLFLFALLCCVWLFFLWFCVSLFVLFMYTLFQQLPYRPAFCYHCQSDIFPSVLYFIWCIQSFLLTMLSFLSLSHCKEARIVTCAGVAGICSLSGLVLQMVLLAITTKYHLLANENELM